MHKLKLGVIGEPCIDYIHRGEKATNKQFGGILYSIVSLAVISKESSEIYPIMNLGSDEYDNVVPFLEGFKNIKTNCIRKSSHNTRVVNLFYETKDGILNTTSKKTYDREESSTEPTLPVEYEDVKYILNELDGILINMVSGVDITIDTLKKLRKNFNGYVHMDLHNLVMQTFPDGTRRQLPVKNWEDWCSQSNTLQMNESEIAVLTGGNVTEFETAEKILRAGKVKHIIITRGNEGVSLYQMKTKLNNTELEKRDFPAVINENFIDSTGCGDVFGASFFYMNALNNLTDINNSINFANKIAGLNTVLSGVEQLYKLYG